MYQDFSVTASRAIPTLIYGRHRLMNTEYCNYDECNTANKLEKLNSENFQNSACKIYQVRMLEQYNANFSAFRVPHV